MPLTVQQCTCDERTGMQPDHTTIEAHLAIGWVPWMPRLGTESQGGNQTGPE